MDNLVWNVFYHDINRNEIRTFNVFQHGGFREDIQKHFKKYKDRDVFAEEMRR